MKSGEFPRQPVFLDLEVSGFGFQFYGKILSLFIYFLHLFVLLELRIRGYFKALV
jgi:hypothetical protein